MHPSHYIINEFRGHFGGNCEAWHTTEPYSFVFGPSQYIDSDQLAPTLESPLANLLKSRERTAYEKANKIDRNIVFLTWDSTLELDTLARLGLTGSRDQISNYLISKSTICSQNNLAARLSWMPLVSAADTTGSSAPETDGKEIQILLALQYMDPQLKPKVYDRVNFGQTPITPIATWLDFTWRGSVLDTLNVPLVDLRTVPGETQDHQLRGRTEARLNDDNVPKPPKPPKPGKR
ncbi:uncharacterized protein FTJAE_11206 [Fusarium tjaetaba]|uniref:Uncharacterized protein n=1 Tax=Fusarium tjaetaba TaxID=1567544 RepID=A0A8H5VGL6_9HYPO|nr:uncharacterized protein FTJAE_11206 [Fusarium tjaetaba]KAF5621573.1 hypothetical protein FTJAE_11206 [Fusarium tjaetaba]